MSGSSNLNELNRQEMVKELMASALQLSDTVLEGKVEGEEPFFVNATGLPSKGARTTPRTIRK